MARADLTLEVDKYFTDTRVFICMNFDCVYNQHKQGEANCLLKNIAIGKSGQCEGFKPEGKDNGNNQS